MKKKKLQITKIRPGRKSKKVSRTIPLLLPIVIGLVGLGLTVFMVQQQQTTQQLAAQPAGPALKHSPVFNCMGSCPSVAPEPGNGKPSLKEKKGEEKNGEEEEEEEKKDKQPNVKNPGNGDNLPPGLANRGDKPLPPGIAKKVEDNPLEAFLKLLMQLIAPQQGGKANPANPAEPGNPVGPGDPADPDDPANPAEPGNPEPPENPGIGIGQGDDLPPGMANRGDKPLPPGIAKKVKKDPLQQFIQFLQQLVAPKQGGGADPKSQPPLDNPGPSIPNDTP